MKFNFTKNYGYSRDLSYVCSTDNRYLYFTLQCYPYIIIDMISKDYCIFKIPYRYSVTI